MTGAFDTATITAIKALQTADGIAVSGTTDASTWQAALKLPFVAADWTASAAKATAAHVARTARGHRSEIGRVDSPRR